MKKWIFILLISCQSEDMKLFVTSLGSEGIPTFQGDTLNIGQFGQSLAVGEYGVDVAGYIQSKIDASNARFLFSTDYVSPGITVPTWQPFSGTYMNPFHTAVIDGNGNANIGLAGQYRIAELLRSIQGLDFDFIQIAKGGTAFGTDALPLEMHISSDGLTLQPVAAHMQKVLTYLQGISYPLHGINWLHGESDARIPLALSVYDVNFTRMVDMILAIYPNVKIFVRIMPTEAIPWIEGVEPAGTPTVDGWNIINGHLQTVIDAYPNNLVAVPMPVPHVLETRPVPIHEEEVNGGTTRLGTAFHSAYESTFNFQ